MRTQSFKNALIKLAALAAALALTLRRRGVTDPAASLTAEAGIAVFKIAFERLINGTTSRTSRNSSETRSTSSKP